MSPGDLESPSAVRRERAPSSPRDRLAAQHSSAQELSERPDPAANAAARSGPGALVNGSFDLPVSPPGQTGATVNVSIGQAIIDLGLGVRLIDLPLGGEWRDHQSRIIADFLTSAR